MQVTDKPELDGKIVDVQLTDRDLETGETGNEDREYDQVPNTERETNSDQYASNTSAQTTTASNPPPRFEVRKPTVIFKEFIQSSYFSLELKVGKCAAKMIVTMIIMAVLAGLALIIFAIVQIAKNDSQNFDKIQSAFRAAQFGISPKYTGPLDDEAMDRLA